MENMDDEALSILKKLIVENSGYVRVFIHPSSAPLGFGQEERVEPMELLVKLLTTKPRKKVPIIIFEDPSNSWALDFNFRGKKLSQNAYLIPTKYDDPTPSLGAWGYWVRKFKKLGVRNIIIGGLYLYLYEGRRIQGCVYGAGFELSKHFNIKISHFVNHGKASIYATHCGKFCPKDHKNKR